MKITLIERKEFSYQLPAERGGGLLTGYAYGGFTEDGQVLSFTSPKQYETTVTTKFDPSHCVDVKLRVKIWDGKVKYQEDLNSAI